MAYFKLHVCDERSLEDETLECFLIAQNFGEILDTLQFFSNTWDFTFGYEREVPASQIENKRYVSLNFREKLTVRDTWTSELIYSSEYTPGTLEITVLPDFKFRVNCNAWSDFKERAKSYSSLKSGALYRWNSGGGRPEDFLPEKVMEALHKYDFDQHEDFMRRAHQEALNANMQVHLPGRTDKEEN